MHNYEVDLGAANALCLKLGYILLQQGNSNSFDVDFYNEIEMTCACLKLVYGCSMERRIQSFRDVGYSELVPLLIQVLNLADFQVESRHATLQALNVLRVFSKLEMAKPSLIQFPHLLSTLVQLVWSFESQEGTRWIVFEKDAEPIQLQIMGILKDLVFRTCNQDKEFIYNSKGLVTTLEHFANKPTVSRRVQEYVAAIWWNLALCKSIASQMALNPEILSSLLSLMQPSNSLTTRRNAISSIGNLATIPSNHERLLTFQDRIFVQFLIKTTRTEDDSDSRRRAMRTLRCLCSDAAGHSLRCRIDFTEFLSSVAKTDVDRDTRVQALECMAHIAADEQAMDTVGDTIKTALIATIEDSSDARLTLDACRPLSVCLSRNDPTPNKFQTSFFSKLASAVDQSKDAASHRAVATIVSRSDTKVPCFSFLNLLAALLSPVGPDFEHSQSIAMATIYALAHVETNKKPLAENERLLTALVNFVMTTDSAKKDDAKSLILQLVPEL